MTEQPIELEPDRPPKSGRWADEHPTPTPAEIAEGNRLGREIDPDDDQDNGGV